MAARALRKMGRTQLQEFVQSIARALGPRGRMINVEGGSEGGLSESDLRRDRIERSVNASSSANGNQAEFPLEADAGGVNGPVSRREAARAKRMRKQVQYMESVLHVTGTAVSVEAPDGERRRSGRVVLLDPAVEPEHLQQAGVVAIIGQDPESLVPVTGSGERAARRRVVPLETTRAGVSDSILKGHFHLPPPWGAGTARPLHRKEYSTRAFTRVALLQPADITGIPLLLEQPPLGLVQLRGLAAKAKRDKKAKSGKGSKVVWNQDEDTGEAIEVGGSGGRDVARAEPDFDVEEKMEAALVALQREFGKLRTGRASPDMLDHVMVESYGSRTPLNRVGTVSVLSPQMLSITPFDQSLLKAIEKGVRASPMELNPKPEGTAVLVPVPTLTQEVRQNMIKVITKAGEAAKLSVRRARKDALDSIGKKEEGMPIDEVKRQEKKVDELTKLYVKRVDEACRSKGKDILEG
ncbi:mitochondrial ribosome releasing factor RRF [Klebsormidium nitens]|uniref:Ribosome-recycling factor, chloroplastic n=1 Tax=Klebsormidium nitens TaxID=105231 RepID=A0A1Y1IH24_KLENI|nr:mitochondrial ribosome releasing factor RRF [Klebsormidium nitens]|eukprot:GAQ89362.1 mitochondrial ribosome releasing factor RRF [Klebsormidium nitens]